MKRTLQRLFFIGISSCIFLCNALEKGQLTTHEEKLIQAGKRREEIALEFLSNAQKFYENDAPRHDSITIGVQENAPFSIDIKLRNVYYAVINQQAQFVAQAPAPLQIVYTPEPFGNKKVLELIYQPSDRSAKRSIDLSNSLVVRELSSVFKNLIDLYYQKNQSTLGKTTSYLASYLYNPSHNKNYTTNTFEIQYSPQQEPPFEELYLYKQGAAATYFTPEQRTNEVKLLFDALTLIISSLNDHFKGKFLKDSTGDNVILRIAPATMYKSSHLLQTRKEERQQSISAELEQDWVEIPSN